MATDRKPDEILLNALVDGELSPSEQAVAAARLASDREFARAYATLSKLKASVIESTEMKSSAEIRLPVSANRNRRTAAIGAASAAACLVLAVALFRFVPGDHTPSAADKPEVRAVPVVFSAEPVIPDLAPAGLHLARTVVNADAGGQALIATYVGPRGCRLELWVSNAHASARGTDATARRAWRAGGLAYELLAYGMPAERFEKVAAAAEEATRATALPEEPDQRLIQARVASAPCLS
jgi:hypothetical protein